MKIAAIVSLAVLAFAAGAAAECVGTHGHRAHCATVVSGNVRCSMCNGTGFGPNTRGEKGKGPYKCIRCNGTGRI